MKQKFKYEGPEDDIKITAEKKEEEYKQTYQMS